MKSCSKCLVVKPLSEFSKDKYQKDGLCARCKSCRKQHYEDNKQYESNRQKIYFEKNREDYREKAKVYYQLNKSAFKERARAWYEKNKDSAIVNCRNWRERNRIRVAGYTRERRRKQAVATTAWADMELMESMYLMASELTKETGIKYSVDHIVPITSDIVCGLHCEDNLQILTLSENSEKSNLTWPDMP
jgi:hypothetical protein